MDICYVAPGIVSYNSTPQHAYYKEYMHLHHGSDVVGQRAFIVRGAFANHNTDLATQDIWHYSCMDSSHAQWRRLEKQKNKNQN